MKSKLDNVNAETRTYEHFSKFEFGSFIFVTVHMPLRLRELAIFLSHQPYMYYQHHSIFRNENKVQLTTKKKVNKDR